MINRVLIRIKVVQLLYSYFLVQNNFAVQSTPTAPTKEKRFAYSLYLDYLYLMAEIAANITRRGAEGPLGETRFMQRLVSDSIFRSVRSKYATHPFPFASCVEQLVEDIKESAIYKNFLKDPKSDSRIWYDLFRNFIAVNKSIADIASGFDNYSLRGLDRAKDMVTETLSDFASSQDNLADGVKDLQKSLDKSRELYFRLLMLPVDITYLQEVELDERRHRYLASDEDRHPNTKFIDNELVKLIDADEEIKEYTGKNKISWVEQDRDLVRHLLKKIKESELYREYIDDPVADLKTDCEFWKKVMRGIILNDPEFLEVLESKSIFWNDDIDIIGEFVLKTFRRFEEKASDPQSKIGNPVLPMFKDEEDTRFGRQLFEAAVKNRSLYEGYIEEVLNTKRWEWERLAYMDVVIMVVALAEICNFPKIPLQASMNEYIEIAKCYSSAKSGAFINGLLANVISNLKEKGKLRK